MAYKCKYFLFSSTVAQIIGITHLYICLYVYGMLASDKLGIYIYILAKQSNGHIVQTTDTY